MPSTPDDPGPGLGPASVDVIPQLSDLPGGGWAAIDEPLVGGGTTDAELIDCVGPEFPSPDEVRDTASSSHFVRSPHQLVQGIGVLFATDEAGGRAARVLGEPSFARCLGRSVAADLLASPAAAELLAIDVNPGAGLQRVTFNTASASGVRPIHLDIVVVASGPAMSLLWFADTPHPFPPAERRHVVARIASRLPRPRPR